MCFLWSHNFRTDTDPRVIGVPGGTGEVMPPGYEYYFTFTPASANAGVLINSFVLDDYIGWFDGFTHQIEWRITRLTPGGAVVASGTANITGGANVTGSTVQLYVNGAAVTAAVTGSGVYKPNGPGVNLAIGGHDYGGGGSSPCEGLVDEVAWYPTALSAAKIMEHYTTTASLTAGAYSRLVFRDGAAKYLRQTTASSPPAHAIGSLARAADGSSVTFSILNTRPNRNYTVYYSTDLKTTGQPGDWTALTPVLAPAGGLTVFQDSVASGLARAFYIVRDTTP